MTFLRKQNADYLCYITTKIENACVSCLFVYVKTKIIKYGTEDFFLADDLYQKVLDGTYVPVTGKRKELVYERKNN